MAVIFLIHHSSQRFYLFCLSSHYNIINCLYYENVFNIYCSCIFICLLFLKLYCEFVTLSGWKSHVCVRNVYVDKLAYNGDGYNKPAAIRHFFQVIIVDSTALSE